MKRLSVFTILVIAALLLTAFIPSANAAGVRFNQVSTTGTPSSSSRVVSLTEGGNVFIQLSALQNFKVNDVTGQQVGTVSDFVINPVKSRIDWIVTSLSNGNTVLLPWSSVSSVDANAQVFTFKDPAARLQNAPVFNANNFNFNDAAWKSDTIAYWMRSFVNNQLAQGGNVPATGGTGTPAATSMIGNTETPVATSTVQETSVPATGGTTTSSNQGGTTNGFGLFALLASQLLNQPVYSDVGVRTANVPTTGGTVTGSSTGSSSSSSATPEATSSAGSVSSTPEATSSAITTGSAQSTSVPATGGTTGSTTTTSQGVNSQQIGTVVGAVVTRINGNIDYLLIAPSADLIGNTNGSGAAVSTPLATSMPAATNVPAATLEVPSTPNATSSVGGTISSVAPTAEATTTGSVTLATPAGTSVPSTGGATLNNGQPVVAVPFRSVILTNRDGHLVLATSPYLLSRAPFISNNLPDQLGYFWDNNTFNYWASGGQQFARSGAPGITVTGGQPSQTGTQTPSATGQPSSFSGTNQDQGSVFVTLKTLLSNNFKVVDQSGNTIGTATDYVVNVPNSRIDWIVMNTNNGRSVLVPWSSLSAVNSVGQQFVFKDAGSRLENAPDFNASALDFNSLDWDQNTIAYWLGGGSNVAQSGAGVPATGGTSATPQATTSASVSGTSVPSTGGTSSQSNNSGLGTYAVLASQLLNKPVYAAGGSTNNVPATGGTGNTSGTGSTSSSSGSVVGTPEATSSAGVMTSGTPMVSSATSSTSVPATGGTLNNTSGEQIGTVVGAVVTRINGDIRYLLVQLNDNVVSNTNSATSTSGTSATSVATSSTGVSGTSTSGSTLSTPEATSTSGTGTTGSTGSTGSSSGTVTPGQAGVPTTGGTGNRVVAIPMSAVSLQNGQLVLRVSTAFLANAPTYDFGTFPDALNFGWDTGNLLFWSGTNPSPSSNPSPTATP